MMNEFNYSIDKVISIEEHISVLKKAKELEMLKIKENINIILESFNETFHDIDESDKENLIGESISKIDRDYILTWFHFENDRLIANFEYSFRDCGRGIELSIPKRYLNDNFKDEIKKDYINFKMKGNEYV